MGPLPALLVRKKEEAVVGREDGEERGPTVWLRRARARPLRRVAAKRILLADGRRRRVARNRASVVHADLGTRRVPHRGDAPERRDGPPAAIAWEATAAASERAIARAIGAARTTAAAARAVNQTLKVRVVEWSSTVTAATGDRRRRRAAAVIGAIAGEERGGTTAAVGARAVGRRAGHVDVAVVVAEGDVGGRALSKEVGRRGRACGGRTDWEGRRATRRVGPDVLLLLAAALLVLAVGASACAC